MLGGRYMSDRSTHVNPWIVTIAVMLATFMEVLDTTVVNVSIPHIAGNMGSTYEEGTWVVTSYLVSNAIVLPMAGWLAARFGRRRMLMLCVTSFTTTSLLCGMATSLEWLIFFRVLQGLSGGGLQPLSQAALLETFPPKQHGTAMAAFGLGIIMAPILGPMLGGWITDNYSWRWIFYLNLPVGILSVLMIANFVVDPHYLAKHKGQRVDLLGIAFLALGFGMLQVVLDTGQRKDWFGSNEIRLWTALCVVGLVGMVVRELTAQHPIVDLRVLKDRNFRISVVLMTMVGFGLYGSLTIMPMFLQELLGYPAFQSGLALSPRGIGSLVATPIIGVLSNKYDPRKLAGFGVILFAVTMFMLSHQNLDSGYWNIFWPQVLQGFSLGCLFIPLAVISIVSITKEKMGNATSIYNLMRNIGGSLGISLMTTFIARRSQFHQSHLVEHISPSSLQTRNLLLGLQSWFQIHIPGSAADAQKRALGALYGMVQQQAAMLSFVECFRLTGILFLCILPLLLLLYNPHQLRLQAKRKLARESPSAMPTPESSMEEFEPELAGVGSLD
jgi:DHA2 family multidrug resistance protein